MTEPDRVEFHRVGETRWKQPIKLVRERHEGVLSWTIVQEAESQRDESAAIRGLSLTTLEQIAAIARSEESRRR